MSLIKIVAFDTDGVIAKSDHLHFEVFNEVLLRHGFTDLDWETYVKEGFISYDDRAFFDEYLKAYGRTRSGDNPSIVEQLAKEKVDRTAVRLKSEGVQLYNYVGPVTAYLARKHVDMIEVTGSTADETALYFRDRQEIRERFKIVITASDGLPSKPNPAPYREGLKRLNKKLGKSMIPNEVIVIEDSVKGVQSAKSAGMFVIGIENTTPSPLDLYRAGADLVVKTLTTELFDKILSLRRPEDFLKISLLDRLGKLTCVSDSINIGTAACPIFLNRSEWRFRNPGKTALSKTELLRVMDLMG